MHRGPKARQHTSLGRTGVPGGRTCPLGREGLGTRPQTGGGPKARHICRHQSQLRNPSIPHIPLIERNMILLEKRAHLVLETPLAMVRLLPVDITLQRAQIRRSDGKQTIPALPRKLPHPLLLHPDGRRRLDLRHELRGRSRRCQPHRKMNVIGNTAHAKALAIQYARRSREIGMKRGTDFLVDQRRAMFRAEDDMHQVEAQRLRHGTDYMPGLQPSPSSANAYLGLRPRLVCRRTFGPHLSLTSLSQRRYNGGPQ